MTDEPSPLGELHAAVQKFSNALADGADQVGVVTAAVVVWQETSFTEDGDTSTMTAYAATGDGASGNMALGLSAHLLEMLKRDIMGTCSHDD